MNQVLTCIRAKKAARLLLKDRGGKRNSAFKGLSLLKKDRLEPYKKDSGRSAKCVPDQSPIFNS